MRNFLSITLTIIFVSGSMIVWGSTHHVDPKLIVAAAVAGIGGLAAMQRLNEAKASFASRFKPALFAIIVLLSIAGGYAIYQALIPQVVDKPELTIDRPSGPVGDMAIVTGLAPSEKSVVYVIVNPNKSPNQFWVQGKAVIYGRGNWVATVHVGDQVSVNEKFRIFAVADPVAKLNEGLVLDKLPAARSISGPITLLRE